MSREGLERARQKVNELLHGDYSGTIGECLRRCQQTFKEWAKTDDGAYHEICQWFLRGAISYAQEKQQEDDEPEYLYWMRKHGTIRR